MRKKIEFYSLIERCRTLGLATACNTNASYISTDDCHSLLTGGPNHLVISLDGHNEEIHDYIRGVGGAFKRAKATLNELVKMKNTLSSCDVEILTNTVLFDRNIPHVADYVTFAEQLGVDGIIFQLLSMTFHNQTTSDPFYNKHYFQNRSIAMQSLQALSEMIACHPIIRTSRNDFLWMIQQLDHPTETLEGVCASHERNIMVDSRGHVRLCFNMDSIWPHEGLGNLRQTSLRSLIFSDIASGARSAMAACRRPCGMLNCHRRAL